MQSFGVIPTFAFMKHRRTAFIVCGVLAVASLLWLTLRGLNLGFDFTGGVMLEVSFPRAPDVDELREGLASAGYEDAQVQTLGSTSDVLIRLPPLPEGQDAEAAQEQILDVLLRQDPGVIVQDRAAVEPQIGEELVEQGGLAMLFALIMIFIYVMLRFRWKLAFGAEVATIFDVVVTIAVVAVIGLPFDLTTLGAILAVMGYSLNDKIVVYDRIRDNFRLVRRGTPEAIVDLSINQTLARTLVTGVSALLVLLALLFVGGDALRSFSISLIAGILIGTSSTIFLASPMVLALDVTAVDFAPPKQEKIDDLP